MRRASFTRKLHCDPERFRVRHREMMRCLNIYLVFHKFDRQNMCVRVTRKSQLIGTWNVRAMDSAASVASKLLYTAS